MDSDNKHEKEITEGKNYFSKYNNSLSLVACFDFQQYLDKLHYLELHYKIPGINWEGSIINSDERLSILQVGSSLFAWLRLFYYLEKKNSTFSRLK